MIVNIGEAESGTRIDRVIERAIATAKALAETTEFNVKGVRFMFNDTPLVVYPHSIASDVTRSYVMKRN